MMAAAVERMSQDDNRGPGRPPLASDEPTVRIVASAPESLRDEISALLGRGGVAPVVRGLLRGYLRLPESVRQAIDTEGKIEEFMVEAGKSRMA